MPKRSDGYMQERRRQILDAAMKCGLRKGWSRVTIDDVATMASLSKGAVYVHFQSKQALLLGLLETSVEALEAITACRTVEELTKSFSSELASFDASHGRQLAIKQIELLIESTRSPALQNVFRRGTERLIENVTKVVRRLRPELSDERSAEVALTLVILLHGTRSLRAQADVPSSQQLQRVVQRQVTALLLGSQSTPLSTAQRSRKSGRSSKASRYRNPADASR
jgi:AcrR family transcriptional regulator